MEFVKVESLWFVVIDGIGDVDVVEWDMCVVLIFIFVKIFGVEDENDFLKDLLDGV